MRGEWRTLFEARWAGRCDACGNRIEPGDDIGYVSDYNKPVCAECHAEGGEG